MDVNMDKNLEQSVLDKNSAATQAARDVFGSFGKVVKSDLRLAVAEFKQSAAELKMAIPTFFIAALVAILGVFPLMAFMVIGLGRILSDNYWLSSLFVGLLFSGIGGFIAYNSLRKFKITELMIPRTRENLLKEQVAISRKLNEIKKDAA